MDIEKLKLVVLTEKVEQICKPRGVKFELSSSEPRFVQAEEMLECEIERPKDPQRTTDVTISFPGHVSGSEVDEIAQLLRRIPEIANVLVSHGRENL